MELEKQLIHRNYEKAKAYSQITVSDDYSLPEAKPPADGVLLKQGELIIRDVHTEKSKVRIRGIFKVQVLYRTSGGVLPADSLETEHAFDEVLYVDGAESGDHLKLDWTIESLQVSVIHSAKLGIRAVISLFGEIIGSETAELTEKLAEEAGLCQKQGNISLAEPVLDRKDTLRIRDEFTLPANRPNIRRLLWKNIRFKGVELQPMDGMMLVKGDMIIFVLYEAEGERGQLQWCEQQLPFQGKLDVAGLTSEMCGNPEWEPAHWSVEAKQDYDGELRQLLVELTLDIQMRIYEERTLSVLSDAYSTRSRLIPQIESKSFEALRCCKKYLCRIQQKETAEESEAIVQLLTVQGRLCSKNVKLTEQGMTAEGVLEVQLLGLTADRNSPLECRTMLIPYSQTMEVSGMEESDRWQLVSELESLSAVPAGSQAVEIRAAVSFALCVMEQKQVSNISAVTCEECPSEEQQKKPGLLIHYVQPQETLWEIAKEHQMAAEDIRRLNELTAEEVLPGQKLLLTKQALAL